MRLQGLRCRGKRTLNQESVESMVPGSRTRAGGLAIGGLAAAALLGCDGAPEPEVETTMEDDEAVHAEFLGNLAAQCEDAFRGEVLDAPEGDPYFAEGDELVMHVRECSEEEVRIPVHAGDDHSRTWIFTRTGGGVDLRHDHRYEDGTPEENNFYGAFARADEPAEEALSGNWHEFRREDEDGELRGWAVEIEPGERYVYGTRRDGEWRHQFAFDLSEPVDPPPDPWGHPPVEEVPGLPEAQEAFWENLAEHCGEAFRGEIIQRPDDDQHFEGDEELTVHFRECGEDRLGLPFHVEEDRSRTWILQRTTAGIDLRHDHRYENGAPEESTWYGAHTPDEGSPERQEFLRTDEERGGTGWAIEIVPGERYTYGTIDDEGEWRHQLDFDLSEPIEPPPAPWGHD